MGGAWSKKHSSNEQSEKHSSEMNIKEQLLHFQSYKLAFERFALHAVAAYTLQDKCTSNFVRADSQWVLNFVHSCRLLSRRVGMHSSTPIFNNVYLEENTKFQTPEFSLGILSNQTRTQHCRLLAYGDTARVS